MGSRIPRYAENVPPHRLVRLLCKAGCGRMTYAQLEDEENPLTKCNADDQYGGRKVAYCLVCGGRALDSYNWLRL